MQRTTCGTKKPVLRPRGKIHPRPHAFAHWTKHGAAGLPLRGNTHPHVQPDKGTAHHRTHAPNLSDGSRPSSLLVVFGNSFGMGLGLAPHVTDGKGDIFKPQRPQTKGLLQPTHGFQPFGTLRGVKTFGNGNEGG
jgi:hypothetical protein